MLYFNCFSDSDRTQGEACCKQLKKRLIQSPSVQRWCFFNIVIRTYSVWVEGQLIAQPGKTPASTNVIALETEEGARLSNEASLIKVLG
jgi:hypothetical protein